MVSHLYGTDAYRLKRYLRELTAKYQAKYPEGSVGSFDIEEADTFEKLRAFSGSGGLFAKVSLAIVLHPEEGSKEFVNFLKENVENPASSIIVVSDKKLTKEFAFLYDGKEKEFDTLTGGEFLAFIKAESKVRGFEVSDAQLKTIGALYDADTWGAMTEVERVASGGEIMDQPAGFDFLSAMSGLSAGDVRSRLRSLFLLLENDDAAKIFNMAGGWARGMSKVRLADYDIAVKSGKLEFADALFDYVL